MEYFIKHLDDEIVLLSVRRSDTGVSFSEKNQIRRSKKESGHE